MKAPAYKIEYALLNKDLISKEQLDKAKDVQVKEHIKLEDALVKLGFLTYSEIIQFFSSQYNLPIFDINKANITIESDRTMRKLLEILSSRSFVDFATSSHSTEMQTI